jgi:hypothetical protein
MGVFDWIKKTGSKIFDGIRSGVRKVVDFARSVRDNIGKGMNVVKNIPVIGDLVEYGSNVPIPIFGGRSLRDVGDIASGAIDAGGAIADSLDNPTEANKEVAYDRLRDVGSRMELLNRARAGRGYSSR